MKLKKTNEDKNYKKAIKLYKESLVLSIRHLEKMSESREIAEILSYEEKNQLIEEGRKFMIEILKLSSLSKDVKDAVKRGLNSGIFILRPDEKRDVV